MAKFLTVDDSQPRFSIQPMFQTTEIQVVPAVGSGGGGGPPLSLAYYVDAGTTVPGADQTGSIDAPFSTCTAALAALNAAHPNVNGAMLLVVAGDYTAEGPLTCGEVGFRGIPGGAATFLVLLPPCDWTGVGPPDVVLSNVSVSGLTGNGSIEAFGCDLGSFNMTGALFAEECSLSGTFAGFQLVCRDCSIAYTTIAISGSQQVELTDTSIQNLTSINFGAAGGLIQLDGFSANELHLLGSAVTTNGQRFVVNDTGSAQLTVTVPALAAGELGYANVSVVGTELEGLTVADVVVVNPVNDLHAAGAGGGFMAQPRVSAADTVRIAFVGALTGGAAAFNIARVSRVVPPPA